MVADTEAAAKKQRILIVEDEPFIALALEAILLELGFDVAGSAAQLSVALELIGREEIDGAILDVNLGSQNIGPVADILAARACPFFFTTGYDISGIPARHAGRPVLQKPFGWSNSVRSCARSSVPRSMIGAAPKRTARFRVAIVGCRHAAPPVFELRACEACGAWRPRGVSCAARTEALLAHDKIERSSSLKSARRARSRVRSLASALIAT